MLIISFDALGDSDFSQMATWPAFASLAGQSAVFRDVPSLFLSNTYPIHTSVATGVLPCRHGITSNTEPFPARHPRWRYDEREIHAKTLWQAAAEHGLGVAAVFWPVTAFAGTIRWNVPEVEARPGQNQVWTSLRAGSKLLQLRLFLRHHRLLDGLRQPRLDSFSTACMADILRAHKPGLALIHLTAYDTLCHQFGRGSSDLEEAFGAMDANLARLLDAAGEDEDIILFSDHSQINVHTVLDPNRLLVDMDLLRQGADGYICEEGVCFFECCGGSAFFHAGSLPPGRVDEIRLLVGQGEGFRRFLTADEMDESGMDRAAFGFCALAGYCYESYAPEKKANHGYPLDIPDYRVFYMVRGCGLHPGSITQGGSLLDIAPLAARRLGLDFFLPDPMDTVGDPAIDY